MKENRAGSAGKRQRITKSDLQLWSLLLPAGIMIVIFCYVPMFGITMGFTKYIAGTNPFDLIHAHWVGFKYFEQFFDSIYFSRILINTIRLSLLNLAFGFTAPIIFAVVLNEVKLLRWKKFVQTASYLPYFISTVVVSGMVLTFLQKDGIINVLFGLFGAEPVEYIAYPEYYPAIYTITNVWKGFGFGSILYFSSISSIDPNLYEAARVDGANRWQQLVNVTLPSLAFIISIQLILCLGHILGSNTDLSLLLYRPSTYSVSDVIGTYIYRNGIENGKYNYTTAVGLFMSAIAVTLTIIANRISNKISGYGMW